MLALPKVLPKADGAGGVGVVEGKAAVLPKAPVLPKAGAAVAPPKAGVDVGAAPKAGVDVGAAPKAGAAPAPAPAPAPAAPAAPKLNPGVAGFAGVSDAPNGDGAVVVPPDPKAGILGLRCNPGVAALPGAEKLNAGVCGTCIVFVRVSPSVGRSGDGGEERARNSLSVWLDEGNSTRAARLTYRRGWRRAELEAHYTIYYVRKYTYVISSIFNFFFASCLHRASGRPSCRRWSRGSCPS